MPASVTLSDDLPLRSCAAGPAEHRLAHDLSAALLGEEPRATTRPRRRRSSRRRRRWCRSHRRRRRPSRRRPSHRCRPRRRRRRYRASGFVGREAVDTRVGAERRVPAGGPADAPGPDPGAAGAGAGDADPGPDRGRGERVRVGGGVRDRRGGRGCVGSAELHVVGIMGSQRERHGGGRGEGGGAAGGGSEQRTARARGGERFVHRSLPLERVRRSPGRVRAVGSDMVPCPHPGGVTSLAVVRMGYRGSRSTRPYLVETAVHRVRRSFGHAVSAGRTNPGWSSLRSRAAHPALGPDPTVRRPGRVRSARPRGARAPMRRRARPPCAASSPRSAAARTSTGCSRRSSTPPSPCSAPTAPGSGSTTIRRRR